MKYLLIFCLVLLNIHCQSIDKEVTEKSLFEDAQRQARRGYYVEAAETILQLKYRFPYSSYTPQTDLLRADMLFDQAEFLDAQKSYREFIRLYPRSKNKRYAFYKQIVSGDKKVPQHSGRDLSRADEIIRLAKDFLKKYKKGEYVKEVKAILATLYHRKAEKEFQIAYFYFKKKKISQETLNRLDKVVRLYPDTPVYLKALNLALQMAQKLGDQNKVRRYLEKIKRKKREVKNG